MKKHFLSILLILLSATLFSQHPYPAFLLDTTSVWYMEWGWTSQFGSNYHFYSLSGEFYHEIEGKEYLVVRENGENIYITGTGGGSGPSYVNKNHFVRTDSVNRRILFYDQDSLKERILFDFNLSLGDTLKPYQLGMGTSRYEVYPAPEFGKLKVVSIDSIWAGRQFIHTYTVVSDSFGPEAIGGIIYEGIGHNWGLVNPFANVGPLNCFSHNGKGIIGNGPCREMHVSIEDIGKKVEVKLANFPEKWSLKIDFGLKQLIQFRLLDVQGRVLLQKNIKQTNNGLLTEEIPKSSLPSGIYFLQIIADNELQTLKLWRE